MMINKRQVLLFIIVFQLNLNYWEHCKMGGIRNISMGNTYIFWEIGVGIFATTLFQNILKIEQCLWKSKKLQEKKFQWGKILFK